MCTKVPFYSPLLAVKVGTRLNRSQKYEMRGVHFCMECRAWHLTSKPASGKKRKYARALPEQG